MFFTSTSRLKQLAALTWYAGVVALLMKGGRLLIEAIQLEPGYLWPTSATILAILVGSVKSRFIFIPSCQRNLDRIDALPDPQLWQFFRPLFFLFLALMISGGALLSRLAQGSYPFLISVAALDLSVGVALLTSSYLFWSRSKA